MFSPDNVERTEIRTEQFGSSFPYEELSKALRDRGVTRERVDTHSKKYPVVFTTQYATHDDDAFLAVCGSTPELGGWSPSEALIAKPLDNDWWVSSTELRAATDVEWKWIAVNDRDGTIRWEERANRRTTVGDCGSIEHGLWNGRTKSGPLEYQSPLSTEANSEVAGDSAVVPAVPGDSVIQAESCVPDDSAIPAVPVISTVRKVSGDQTDYVTPAVSTVSLKESFSRGVYSLATMPFNIINVVLETIRNIGIYLNPMSWVRHRNSS